jgi:hypothetical protein
MYAIIKVQKLLRGRRKIMRKLQILLLLCLVALFSGCDDINETDSSSQNDDQVTSSDEIKTTVDLYVSEMNAFIEAYNVIFMETNDVEETYTPDSFGVRDDDFVYHSFSRRGEYLYTVKRLLTKIGEEITDLEIVEGETMEIISSFTYDVTFEIKNELLMIDIVHVDDYHEDNIETESHHLVYDTSKEDFDMQYKHTFDSNDFSYESNLIVNYDSIEFLYVDSDMNYETQFENFYTGYFKHIKKEDNDYKINFYDIHNEIFYSSDHMVALYNDGAPLLRVIKEDAIKAQYVWVFINALDGWDTFVTSDYSLLKDGLNVCEECEFNDHVATNKFPYFLEVTIQKGNLDFSPFVQYNEYLSLNVSQETLTLLKQYYNGDLDSQLLEGKDTIYAEIMERFKINWN